MNKSFLVFLMLMATATLQAQVKIGSAGTANANAVLELDGGTSKGLLLPKLNAAQITAMSTAPDGLVIYNTTDGFLYLRKNAAWQKITDATNGGGLTLPYSGNAATTAGLSVFKIQNTSAGTAISGEALGGGYGVYGYSNTDAGGYFTSVSGPAMITGKGNVGIATLDAPSFPLDVNGRIRLRNTVSASAGIWFDKIGTANTQSSFIGTINDSMFGIWNATGGGFKFFFNHVNNNFGIYNSNPRAPLSFQAVTGNKIDLFYESATAMYGLGIAGSELQLYSSSNTGHTSVGYGSSNSFTETFRVNTGNTVITNPVALGSNIENATYFKTSNYYTGAIKTIGTGASTARLGLFAYSAGASANLKEYLSISDDGNVGVGTTAPNFKLDVAGRMRLRNNANTAGFWLDGITDTLRSFIGTNTNNSMGFYGAGSGWSFLMDVTDGALMIGTTQKATGYKVNVGGKIIAEEVRVQLRAAWPDYVFEKNYNKLSIDELEEFVALNKHLPNIPSAADIEKEGQQLGDVQRKMLEKIEELNLYIIELNKKIKALEQKQLAGAAHQ